MIQLFMYEYGIHGKSKTQKAILEKKLHKQQYQFLARSKIQRQLQDDSKTFWESANCTENVVGPTVADESMKYPYCIMYVWCDKATKIVHNWAVEWNCMRHVYIIDLTWPSTMWSFLPHLTDMIAMHVCDNTTVLFKWPHLSFSVSRRRKRWHKWRNIMWNELSTLRFLLRFLKI